RLVPMPSHAGIGLAGRPWTRGLPHRRARTGETAPTDARSTSQREPGDLPRRPVVLIYTANLPARVASCERRRAQAMIVGTGIDMVEVPRIEQTIARFGDRFLRRIFTEAEIRYCESKANRVERYAARFAAKEAGMKALGTGWSRGIRWRDIEVYREPGSRPTIRFHGKAAELALRIGVKNIALSLSHTTEQAIASVIFERV